MIVPLLAVSLAANAGALDSSTESRELLHADLAAVERDAAWLKRALDDLLRQLPAVSKAMVAENKKRKEIWSKREFEGDGWVYGPARQLHDTFPALYLLALNPELGERVFDPDVSKLRSTAKSVRDRLAARQECARKVLSGHETECVLRIGCLAYVGASSGGLYHYHVGKDFVPNEVPIESPSDIFEPTDSDGTSQGFKAVRAHYLQMEFSACSALSRAAGEFEPERVEWHSSGGFIPNLHRDLDRFRAECSSPVSGSTAHDNYKQLADRFPSDQSLERVWALYVAGREGACKLAVLALCTHVYEARGTSALAYTTKGCDVRRVTVDDVRRDVRNWGTYATDADKEDHLTLADTILACSAAKQAGYSWEFQEPKVSADCRKP